jgi:hypothetical protein
MGIGGSSPLGKAAVGIAGAFVVDKATLLLHRLADVHRVEETIQRGVVKPRPHFQAHQLRGGLLIAAASHPGDISFTVTPFSGKARKFSKNRVLMAA